MRKVRVTWNEVYKTGGPVGVWYGWLLCTARDGWAVLLDCRADRPQSFTRAEVRALLGNPCGIDRGPGMDCGRTVAWLEM